MSYKWVKPVVKGARGPLSEMSIVGKVMVMISLMPYALSYWFMGIHRLIIVTSVGLAIGVVYLALIGDLTSRLRPLLLIWLLSEVISAVLITVSSGSVVTALIEASASSASILIFMIGLTSSLALLRLSELRFILNALGLGVIGDSLILALRYLLNASMHIDELLTLFRALGRVRAKPLVNSLITSGVEHSIAIAQYIEYYGIPSVKLSVRPNRMDLLAALPLAIYALLVALRL